MTMAEIIDGAGFQVSAMVLSFSCIFYYLIKTKSKRLQSKIFFAILLNIFVTALCNFVSALAFPYQQTSVVSRVILEVDQFFYFLVHGILAPLFCFYIALVVGANNRFHHSRRLLYELPMYVVVFFCLTNPLTHWVFYFDSEYNFTRNWAEYIIYVVSIAYYIAAVALILFFWNAINDKTRKALSYFFIVVAIGTLIQLLFRPLHTELIAEAIAIAAIMITVENEEGRKDARTGIYNHAALFQDIQRNMTTKRNFFLICIKMANPHMIMRTVGPANIERLTEMTYEYLANIVPDYSIYYTGIGTFVIMNDSSDRNYNMHIARKIKERFERTWSFQDRDTKFDATIFCVEVPKDFKNLKEIMMLINGSAPAQDAGLPNEVLYGNNLNFLLRRNQVEEAIMSGIRNNSFEVYYQPIYDAKDMSICSGEALLRLHDARIGDIYPDEFLPIAERTGLIFELGDFVLDEVCKFLNSGIPVEMGLESLNVNLSAVQCMQPNYAERIMKVISKYDVDPCRINFEIMESTATTNFATLQTFVDSLREYGFRFLVDDYGIGYSNVHSIFSLDVDVIKIDRTILWEADQSDIGRIIMESSVDMIKKMKKKILISGVESKQQIELATEFGVDFLQGFFFSNPITQNEFIGILKATQLARLEEQRALAASEAMSNFLASMSHEIRTPINAVLGMDEMILRESEDERILEYARTIEGAGRTLLSLINDILDFSKIEAGNMDIVEGEYDLTSVIEDVVNMIQMRADQKGLKLVVNVDPSIPVKLKGDEMRLRQVIINVLNNAVKYTQKGSVSFNIAYERKNEEIVNMIVEVKDTGVGIREEDIEKLFKRFQRLDLDENKSVEGSGLGLAITHQLLNLMNGAIGVESEYGKGSTFTITIPQKVCGEEVIGDFRRRIAMKGENRNMYHESFRAPNARILVVDDTPMNLVVVRELLKKTEITVDEARSGVECLDKITKLKYDIIFLDYRMPNMDGVETLHRMQELENNINQDAVVIALTANAISGARSNFIRSGFDDYMSKPIDGIKLEEMLLMYLPPDKICGIDDGNAPDNARGEAEDLGVDIEGLDINMAIKNCGSKETFEAVFKAFKEDISDRAAVIRKSFEEKDWSRYTIEVHAIKSSARIVGIMELSELAKDLEAAGDNEDVKTIEKGTARLLEMYESYKDAELPEKEEAAPDIKLKKINDKIWIDGAMTVREFAQTMDIDNARLVIDSVREYELNDEQKELVDKAEALISKLQWEELIVLADEVIAGKEV